jgi:hypothetical protein
MYFIYILIYFQNIFKKLNIFYQIKFNQKHFFHKINYFTLLIIIIIMINNIFSII